MFMRKLQKHWSVNLHHCLISHRIYILDIFLQEDVTHAGRSMGHFAHCRKPGYIGAAKELGIIAIITIGVAPGREISLPLDNLFL